MNAYVFFPVDSTLVVNFVLVMAKKMLNQSPTTPIGRGLMKTPRRGQKTSTRTFLNIT